MIRVNWQEVRNIDKGLKRRGFKPESDINVHVYLLDEDGQTETKVSARIKFKEWLLKLYEIQGNRRVTSVIIADGQSRVIWKTKAPVISYGQDQESLPTTGHEHVIRDFAAMDDPQKDAWVEMTLASLTEYVHDDSGN